MTGNRILVLGVAALAALMVGAGSLVAAAELFGDDEDPSVEIAVATASLVNDMSRLLGDVEADAAAGRRVALTPGQRAWLGQAVDHAGDLNRRARTDLAAGDPARRPLLAATREVREVVRETDRAAEQGGAVLRGVGRRSRQRLQRIGAQLEETNRALPTDDVLTAPGFVDVDLPFTEFVLRGDEHGQLLGAVIAPAGDVNGDGSDDVVVGAPGTGEAFVVLGGTTEIEHGVGEIGTREGFRITDLAQTELYFDEYEGETEADAERTSSALGRIGDIAVAGIGDIDGDGYDDIAVGAPATDAGAGEAAGVVHVVYGSERPTETSAFDLGDRGFRVEGPGAYWRVGQAVAGGRDLNGDGISDLVVGGREHFGDEDMTAAQGRAVTWMLPGGERPSGTVRLTRERPPPGGWRIGGIGTNLAVSDDMNGDDLGDVVGGDAYNRQDAPGGAAIVHGRRERDLRIDALRPGGGVLPIEVSFGTLIGTGTKALGDLDDDGLADVGLISRTRTGGGTAHVVFGSREQRAYRLDGGVDGVADIDLGKAEGERDWAREALAPAGDIDGDGKPDLIVATPPKYAYDNLIEPSGALILDGPDLKPGTRTSVTTLARRSVRIETRGLTLSPASDYGYGEVNALSGVGDFDGDGLDDIAIGVPRAAQAGGEDETAQYAGALFVANRAGPADGRGPLNGDVTPNGLGIVKIGQRATTFLDRIGGALSAALGDCAHVQTKDARVSFLVSNGRLTRVAIKGPGYFTGTGIQVGDPAEMVERAYRGRLRSERHAYIPGGEYLEVTDRSGGRLNFNIGADGSVVEIWAGVEPDVDFVEGCA